MKQIDIPNWNSPAAREDWHPWLWNAFVDDMPTWLCEHDLFGCLLDLDE